MGPRQHRPPLGSYETIFVLCVVAGGWLGLYILRDRYHFTGSQILEFTMYSLFAAATLCSASSRR
jgi:hypothetical protein